METTTTIIGILFVAMMVIPIILLNNAHRKKENELRHSLKNMAEEHSLTISEQDMWRNGIIGIDKTGRKVLFCRKDKKGMEKTVIDLREVRDCKAVNTSRSVGSGNGVERPVDKLELAVSWKSAEKPDVFLEFFNADDSLQMGQIQQLADKWAGIMNDHLTRMKKTG